MQLQNWHIYALVLVFVCGLIFLAVFLMDRQEKRARVSARSGPRADEYIRDLEDRGAEIRVMIRGLCLRFSALEADISLLSMKQGEDGRELARKLLARMALVEEIRELRQRLTRHGKHVAELRKHFSQDQVRAADINAG